ncbi:MAG: Holliday junction resolvase RuvX [Bacteroidales bacterium]
MGRILAIDYGRKRAGLAVSDQNRLIAGPLDTVSSHVLMNYLKEYCSSEEVDCFVVGEPLQMNGQASESTIYIVPFLKNLKKNFPDKPIYRVDERFTSRMATRAIAESGLKKKDRRDKALIDKVSAVIILQSYMDNLQNH